MPAPATYTEERLAAYMAATVGDLAAALGWAGDPLPALQEAVNNVLLDYGADDVADVTDIRKVRALASVEAWRAAVASLAARYDFSNPEGSYKRSQMLAGAQKALLAAEAVASEYLPGYGVAYVDEARHDDDPYGMHLPHEWARGVA